MNKKYKLNFPKFSNFHGLDSLLEAYFPLQSCFKGESLFIGIFIWVTVEPPICVYFSKEPLYWNWYKHWQNSKRVKYHQIWFVFDWLTIPGIWLMNYNKKPSGTIPSFYWRKHNNKDDLTFSYCPHDNFPLFRYQNILMLSLGAWIMIL